MTPEQRKRVKRLAAASKQRATARGAAFIASVRPVLPATMAEIAKASGLSIKCARRRLMLLEDARQAFKVGTKARQTIHGGPTPVLWDFAPDAGEKPTQEDAGKSFLTLQNAFFGR